MPLFLEQQVGKDAKLAVWHITETANELLDLLPEGVTETGLREPIPNEELFKQRLASRILLAHVLGTGQLELGVAGIKRTVLLAPSVQISISHAGEFAAVMVSAIQRCGVDVEEVHPRIAKIASRFMHEQEWFYPEHKEDYRCLMLLWAIKEAVFKYGQLTEVEFKTDIVCAPFRAGDSGAVMVHFSPPGVQENLSVHYQFLGNYALAWVPGNI